MATPPHPFLRRRAAIATLHGKERAIAGPLRDAFAIELDVLPLDTDRFGTFTGEIPRAGSQHDALRAKLRAAADAAPRDALVVASEGSFFPDPAFPAVTLDRELVAIYDPLRDIEIVGVAIASARYVGSFTVGDERELDDALACLDVPRHGAILVDGERYHKGLHDREAIAALARAAWAHGTQPRIESDLRAHMHPTRMELIAAAAQDAVNRALACCPSCERPGYGIVERLPGLPCGDCGEPTERIASDVVRCDGCGAREERRRNDAYASPGDCSYCNP